MKINNMARNRFIHDFPRLAKESGFSFQFRSKNIEWAEIAKLDVEDIAINQRFELLEEKMELVINFDLDVEWTKVLDRDLVKLFRLAQLSLCYLRHCQLYVDRCVLLLQEQLSAALEKIESLKMALNAKNNVYECTACQKSFLSANYLESHQRRRHQSKVSELIKESVAVQTDEIFKHGVKVISTGQQTENKRCMSVESQTKQPRCLDVGVMTEEVVIPNIEPPSSKNRDEEMRNIVERLEAVETRAIIEAGITPNAFQSSSLQTNILRHPANIILLKNLLGTLQQSTENLNLDVYAKQKDSPPLIDLTTNPVQEEKLNNSQLEPRARVASEEVSKNIHSDVQKPLRSRRKIVLPEPETVPQPRPRSSAISRRKSINNQASEGQVIEDEPLSIRKRMIKNLSEIEESEMHESVGVQKTAPELFLKKERIIGTNTNEQLNQQTISQNETEIGEMYLKIQEREADRKSKGTRRQLLIKFPQTKTKRSSFFKDFVRRSSPKLKDFKKTLKRSWSNLQDFTSPSIKSSRGLLNASSSDWGTDVLDSEEKEKAHYSAQGPTALLAAKLRELGVDPEWTGIPDGTLSRVMAILKHEQDNHAKLHPMYVKIRERVELHVDHQLGEMCKNLLPKPVSPPLDSVPERLTMYDMDSETESEDYTPTFIPASTPQAVEKRKELHNNDNAESEIIVMKDKTQNKHPSKDSSMVTPLTLDQPTLEKEIDFSIFEIDPPAERVQNSISTPGENSESSDSEKPQKSPLLKSSILGSRNDEVKKRVVFADNFEVEASHQLLDLNPQDGGSSSSSSDWDIPMP